MKTKTPSALSKLADSIATIGFVLFSPAVWAAGLYGAFWLLLLIGAWKGLHSH